MNIVQYHNDIDAFCPIPWNQQPVREYRCLREKRFFRWVTLSQSKYVTKLLAVWITALLLVLFVTALQSPARELNSLNLLMNAMIAELVVLLALAKLYTAWQHVHTRLIHRKIDYIILVTNKTYYWQKPELILVRDALIARFQVRPILTRIARSIALLTAIISSNFLILFLITNY